MNDSKFLENVVSHNLTSNFPEEIDLKLDSDIKSGSLYLNFSILIKDSVLT